MFALLLQLISTTMIVLSLTCAYGQDVRQGQTQGNLPRGVIPHSYKIDLVPDIAQLLGATGQERVGFKGTVQIDIEVRQPVERVVLNANDISFSRVTIDGAASRVEVDQRKQTAAITPASMLRVGRHTLVIEYSGNILTAPEVIMLANGQTVAPRPPLN